MFLSVFYGYFIANSYKTFGEEYIKDDSFLSIIASVSSFCACLRFTFGFMMEKLSFKTTFSILLVIQIFVSGTIYWAVRHRWWYLFWMCFSYWLEGGHFTLMPTVCGKLFGQHGPFVFSIGFICFGISSLSTVFVVKVLLGNIINYIGVFIICLCFQVVSFVLLWTMFDETPLQGSTSQNKTTVVTDSMIN